MLLIAIDTMTVAEKVARVLLSINAVKLRPREPFTYTSGMLSPVYTDNRLLISYPKERKVVEKLLADAVSKGNYDSFAGTATAAIPHTAFVAYILNKPMIYVRSKPKEHGTGSLIEGHLSKGSKVAVIEDLVSTAGSSVHTVKAVRDAGGKCSHIYCIMTYGMKKAEDLLKENKIKLTSLTNFETIVKVAEKQGYIKEKDKNIVITWAQDPAGWGKTMGFE